MHRLWQHDERIRLASPVEQVGGGAAAGGSGGCGAWSAGAYAAGAAVAKLCSPKAATARRRQWAGKTCPALSSGLHHPLPMPGVLNTLCPPCLPPQWPRDAVLARHLLAQAQAKLRNRDAGRRTAVGWEHGPVLPWGGLLAALTDEDVKMLKACRSAAPGLAGCAASKPAPQRLPAQGAAAAAAPPPPPPDTKATPYVMSTEELRRKNKEVGGSRALEHKHSSIGLVVTRQRCALRRVWLRRCGARASRRAAPLPPHTHALSHRCRPLRCCLGRHSRAWRPTERCPS